MADNKTPAGVAYKVATREVSYSGETADIQAVALTTLAGADDAKTATDVDSTNRLPTEIQHRTSAAATATWTSATAVDSTLDLDVTGYASAWAIITPDGAGASDGVIAFEGIVTGSDEFPISDSPRAAALGGGFGLELPLPPGSATTPRAARFNVSGLNTLRMRLSTAIVGSLSVTIRVVASTAPINDQLLVGLNDFQYPLAVAVDTGGQLMIVGAKASGTAGFGVNPVLVAGADGATVRTLTVDASGNLILGASTNAVGKLAANSGVDIGDTTINNAAGASAVNVQDGGNSLTVDGTVTVQDGGSSISIDDNGASITVDGTVAVSGSVAVTNAGTFAVQPAGTIAHDAADSGNPVKVGSRAITGLGTAVANNDRTDNVSDTFGRQLTGHIDPAMQVHKFVSVTTTQTGSDVWSPAAGKRIAVTSVVVASFGTTAARVILWFGANADTTFTVGTDQVLCAASFAPSATSKPGLVFTPAVPVFCTTADFELHLTTDAGISLDITVEGYEY
jgi:hypothetical protein